MNNEYIKKTVDISYISDKLQSRTKYFEQDTEFQ